MSRSYLEDALQISVVAFLRHALPDDVLFFHAPNGGRRDAREAAKLKAMGVRPGIPDLGFLLADGSVRWVELKAGKNGLTPEQQAFRERFPDRVAVCRSVGEVEAALTGWSVPLKARTTARAA